MLKAESGDNACVLVLAKASHSWQHRNSSKRMSRGRKAGQNPSGKLLCNANKKEDKRSRHHIKYLGTQR